MEAESGTCSTKRKESALTLVNFCNICTTYTRQGELLGKSVDVLRELEEGLARSSVTLCDNTHKVDELLAASLFLGLQL